MVEFLSDAASGSLNIAHVCSTLAGIRGSVDGDEDEIAGIQAFAVAGCETQAPCMHITRDHFFQSRLINRQNAMFETFNFFRDDIDTGYLIAHICETCACDKAYISCTDDTNC